MYDTHICKKICDMLCSILLPYYNRLVEKHFLSILIHKKYSWHLKIFSPQKTTHLFDQLWPILIIRVWTNAVFYQKPFVFVWWLKFNQRRKKRTKVFPIQKEILNNVIWISPFKRRSLTPSIQEWLQWVKYFYETIPGCEIVFWRALRTDTLLDSLKCNFHKKNLFCLTFLLPTQPLRADLGKECN